jgi:hypothetical protein
MLKSSFRNTTHKIAEKIIETVMIIVNQREISIQLAKVFSVKKSIK